MRTAFYLSLILFCSVGNATTIRIDKLFRNEEFKHFELSPKGEQVVGSTLNDDKYKVYINKLPNVKKRYIALTIDITDHSNIHDIEWIDDDSFYISFSTYSGARRLLVVDVITKSNGSLDLKTDKVSSKGYVVDSLPDEADRVLFAKKREGKQQWDVYTELPLIINPVI